MFNPEGGPNLYKNQPEKNEPEKDGSIEKIEISISENLPEININEGDILESKKIIDSVFDKEWDLAKENIQIGIFTDRKDLEDFASEKNIPFEKLAKDSALFYINPDTQEKYVFVVKDFERNKRMLEEMGYSESEVADFLRKDTLSGIAHEMTHMHPFFKEHGNQGTDNLWEQEMICSYIENKTKGDISEMLIRWGYIDERKIEEFNLEHGDWSAFSGEKNAVIDYFYPFLIKEYGLNNTREVWKKLQVYSDISDAIREILEIEPEEVVAKFKEKIRDKEYLKNILD